MADTLDAMEERMAKIRTGWNGSPEPGTPAFGERARARRDAIRQSAVEEKPLSIEGRTKQLQFNKERDKHIQEEAD